MSKSVMGTTKLESKRWHDLDKQKLHAFSRGHAPRKKPPTPPWGVGRKKKQTKKNPTKSPGAKFYILFSLVKIFICFPEKQQQQKANENRLEAATSSGNNYNSWHFVLISLTNNRAPSKNKSFQRTNHARTRTAPPEPPQSITGGGR